MVWRKFTIHTITEAEDILSANLADLGLDGVQIEDKIPLSEDDTKGMFIDILPDIGPDDGKADVSFYVEVLSPEDKQDRIEKAK
ncbi:MAG: 50S ribosomal protein L11 methyltransferase, partial [Oribacterium sp.]|nr:50S ribosomal protein L11 methyltransferase [Oribacterium sp.]